MIHGGTWSDDIWGDMVRKDLLSSMEAPVTEEKVKGVVFHLGYY